MRTLAKILAATIAATAVAAGVATIATGQGAQLFSILGVTGNGAQVNSSGELKVAASITPSGTQNVTGTGTAGSPATGVLTVQGITSMTPLLANPGTAANWAVGATAAAPPANAVYNGANGSGATGGLLAGIKTCDLHAKYDASDTGRKTLVTGVSGRKVYICGYIVATAGTATNLAIYEGSDADCATNSAALTPVYVMVANQSIGFMSAFWTGLAVSTNAYYVCISASAANAHQAEIWYTIQ